jgi:hypothetical protein
VPVVVAVPPVPVEVVAEVQPALAMPEPRPVGTTSPVAAQVLALLRTPQSAAAAFLLREILDPPLCLRRGRGRP